METQKILLSILVGILAGAFRVVIGWFKSGENWNGGKAVQTMIVATITGGVIGAALQTDNLMLVFAFVFTGAVTAEDLLKGIIENQKTT